jgi:predicted AAA+ superfamily ATPase
VFTSQNISEKRDYLINLRNSFLFKDILELENIRNSRKLPDLLLLIAFQIGKGVSLNELSISLGIAKQTVERYLDLLEKAFVIMRVQGFSRNLRKEITKSSRYYFYDNGVRNAVINNFNDINTRDDIGALWENYLFMERIKKQTYHSIYANNYFWRTYDRKEIDFVEEREGKLFGYEFKWSAKKSKIPKLWLETYHNAEFTTITRENYLDFVT